MGSAGESKIWQRDEPPHERAAQQPVARAGATARHRRSPAPRPVDRHPRRVVEDGDADKESNFYVLKNTAMPAILSENFFMTNEAECRLLMSEEGRDRIAKIHFEMIQELER